MFAQFKPELLSWRSDGVEAVWIKYLKHSYTQITLSYYHTKPSAYLSGKHLFDEQLSSLLQKNLTQG